MACKADLRQGETVVEALRRVTPRLAGAGIEGAAGDARRLLAAALGCDGAELIGNQGRRLTTDEAGRFDRFVRRRVTREPVSRILGRREFYGRPFLLGPAVLDPRPDTETVIAVALDICASEGWSTRPVRILDIGTGSGAILLTLLAELPSASGVGVDISAAALDVAARNAAALGLDDRCRFDVCDARDVMLADYSLIVSNPPYIRSDEIPLLDPEVAHFDPHLALDGGRDGLAFYRSILSAAARRSCGDQARQWIVFEAGAGQDQAILGIARTYPCFAASPDALIRRRDLGGVVRCVAVLSEGRPIEEKTLELA